MPMPTWNIDYSSVTGDDFSQLSGGIVPYSDIAAAVNERISAVAETGGGYSLPLDTWPSANANQLTSPLSSIPVPSTGDDIAIWLATVQSTLDALRPNFVCPYSYDGSTFTPIPSFDNWSNPDGSLRFPDWSEVPFPNMTFDTTKTINGFASQGVYQCTWRRYFPREIFSLSNAGTEGDIARLVSINYNSGSGNNADRWWGIADYTSPDFIGFSIYPSGSTLHGTGQLYKYTSGVWTLDTTDTSPDVLMEYGLIQPGDYIGPWIYEDIQTACNLMLSTWGSYLFLVGDKWGHTGNLSTQCFTANGTNNYNYGTSLTSTADTESDFTGLTHQTTGSADTDGWSYISLIDSSEIQIGQKVDNYNPGSGSIIYLINVSGGYWQCPLTNSNGLTREILLFTDQQFNNALDKNYDDLGSGLTNELTKKLILDTNWTPSTGAATYLSSLLVDPTVLPVSIPDATTGSFPAEWAAIPSVIFNFNVSGGFTYHP